MAIGPSAAAAEPARQVTGHTFEALSYAVIGACLDVQRALGAHCQEADYHGALQLAFDRRRLQYVHEAEIPVVYDRVLVRRARADFIVWDESGALVLEVKAIGAMRPAGLRQCQSYVEHGEHRLCLLVNFGQQPLYIRRFVRRRRAHASRGRA